jgi:hypothetical protein
VLRTQPQVYASANPGCLVQVSGALRRNGHPLPALHPIELVDASIRGIGRTSCSEQLAAEPPHGSTAASTLVVGFYGRVFG